MAEATDFEQLMLELTNQARMDPLGEFDRLIFSTNPVQGAQANITNALNYFNVDLTVLAAQFAALTSVAPLAWSNNLADAATLHSGEMIAYDSQSHQLPGEADLGARSTNAGYSGWSNLGENIFAFTEDPLYGHAGFFIDWGNTATGIQTPAGHRDNIMSATFTEIGIGVTAENNAATSVGPYVMTQDLGNRFAFNPQLIGVAFTDTDANNFYSQGEGQGGITVTAGAGSTSTATAGGYGITGTAGSDTLTFSGGGLATNVVVNVVFTSQNVKVDLVNSTTIWSSADITLVSGATDLLLLGDGNIGGTGSNAADVITGNRGNNNLSGAGGNDTLDGGAGADTLDGGTGIDAVNYANVSAGFTANLNNSNGNTGEAAGDRYVEIESIIGSQFADILVGNAAANELSGNSGNDILYGIGGNDFLTGAAGNDTLSGGVGDDTVTGGDDDDLVFGSGGNDSLDGGAGNDTVSAGADNDSNVFGGSGLDLVFGGGGNDTINGDAGNDTLSGGSGDDVADGGIDDDLIFGGAGNDIMSGNDGNDTLSGGNGNDILNGNLGNDEIIGGAGNDALNGGIGTDQLTGGSGADTYSFKDGYDDDTILGFENDIDTLNLNSDLWLATHGTLTIAQVISTFATQASPGIVNFDFGTGDTLQVVNGVTGISTADLLDDILII